MTAVSTRTRGSQADVTSQRDPQRTADRRKPNRSRVVLIAIAAGVVLAVFAVLLVRVRLTQLAFELKNEQQTLQQRRELNNKLKVTAANLEAPERVRREARRLGMIEPRIVHYVYSGELAAGAAGVPVGGASGTPGGTQDSGGPP